MKSQILTSSKTVAIISLLLISSLLFVACSGPSQDSVTEQGQQQTEQTVEVDQMQETTGDGDETIQQQSAAARSQTVSYTSPAGEEDLLVSVAVENGVITEASAQVLASHPISTRYQTGFAEALAGEVVGKTVAEAAQIDRIGGASLATGAFTQYLSDFSS